VGGVKLVEAELRRIRLPLLSPFTFRRRHTEE
jgi:hypothetical protein